MWFGQPDFEGPANPDPASCLQIESSLIPSTPQLPSKRPQIPSNRDHKALNKGTLGGFIAFRESMEMLRNQAQGRPPDATHQGKTSSSKGHELGWGQIELIAICNGCIPAMAGDLHGWLGGHLKYEGCGPRGF